MTGKIKAALAAPFECKFSSDAAPGFFSGYGSYFGNADSYDDVIAKGAFKDTLKEWASKGKLPKMLLQHGGMFGSDMVPVGQWTKMEEDANGLYCEGKLFALDTDAGKLRYEAMKSGELDGLSIGFRTRREDVDYGDGKTTPVRTIKRLDLFEVSIVTFGANPLALIEDVKSEDIDEITSLSEAERFLREAGNFSRKSATAIVSRIKRLSQREADGDQETVALLKRAAGLIQTR